MNNFQRKVVSTVKKFYNDYNYFSFALEVEGERFSISTDNFYCVSEDNECVIIPNRKVFIAARRAVKNNKKIEECFNGLTAFKIDLKKLEKELVVKDEEENTKENFEENHKCNCGCNGNCSSNCQCKKN